MRKPELGQIVGGKYRLLRELGRGGMATVFEAENSLTLKRAAIKWLHPQFHDDGQGLQRVLREARAASRIRHENVVDVYDVAEEGSSVYLVMELLQGELLSNVLEREQLPMHELVSLLVPAMRGVVAAHAAGVVHRDIKPDNIFLASDDSQRPVPKVIDFGVSKVAEPDASTATRSGITMGTPRYASYEQLLGARDVDARTDVYAFGVILYEALTGRSPYGDAVTFAEQAVRFATREAAPVSALREHVPEALERLVQRAIAKPREQRTASLEELVLELVPFADPGRYPKPMLVRSQDAERLQATMPERPHAATPAQEPEVQPESTRIPERNRSRRRGLALIVIGVSVMTFALVSMRFEPSPPAPRKSVPIATAPAAVPLALPPEPVIPDQPLVDEPMPPVEPLAAPTPRRVRHVEPVAAPEPTAVEQVHRAGPLRRNEF